MSISRLIPACIIIIIMTDLRLLRQGLVTYTVYIGLSVNQIPILYLFAMCYSTVCVCVLFIEYDVIC